MSARKSKKPVEQSQVETTEALPVEQVVEAPVVAGPTEEELAQAQIEKENRIVDLESEIVKLSERLAVLKKELRTLTKPEKTDGPTKMEQCVELYKANKDKARKELVELFVSTVGLTPAGAKTYVQIILTKHKNG